MQSYLNKAKRIKLLILDVDGVLTSGIIFYGNKGIELKGFHIHDGLGIKLLQKTGVITAVISAKKSEAVVRRLKELNVKHVYLGYDDKLPAYHDLKQKLNLQTEEIAYMGDDLPDLPVLCSVGLAITVPQAPEPIKQSADFITTKKGGRGAVREVCEVIMKAQGTYDAMVQLYLSHKSFSS